MTSLQGTEVFVEGTGAEILVECLHHAGIRTVFGLPGDTGVALYDALYERQDRIRHILTRDERHAAYMADVFARSTNQVGVVEASSGGGTTYLVGGLGDAFAAGSPVLVITSDIHRRSRGSGAITEIDQTKLFSAVTKWAGTVENAVDIPRLVAEALTNATSGRPGPVSLVFPEDVLDERCRVAIVPASITVPYGRVAPDADAIRRAAEALGAAKRPAIFAGSGVHTAAAWDELAQLAERAGIPVATTIHGKGTIADTHPWGLGVAGANGAREYANEYLREADVVLFVGTRANSTDTNSYTSPPRSGTTVFQIDIDAQRAGRNYPGSVPLVGDAKVILGELLDALSGQGSTPVRQELRAWIAERRAEWNRVTHEPLELPDPVLLNPRDVVRFIAGQADQEWVVVGDPGTPTPNLASYWETTRAARSIIIPRGHGPMGYAIPGAIGAAFANPGRQIIGFTTEGSLAMGCGELETAVRFQLPIIYVQFTNGSMGWIKMLQHLYTDRRYFGVDPGPIDAVGLANAMGMPAMRVSSLDDFKLAFTQYRALNGPAFIEVPVPDQINLVPPVAPWQAALAGNAERPVY